MPKEKTAKRPRAAKAAGPAKKKPAGPKRALSAYMFFSQDWRERIRNENPDASFGEIGKLLGAKWKELEDDEKKPYIDQAEKDKARVQQEKSDLEAKANVSGGEGDADEDDE